jgi:trimeric autotransporter adhesin
MTPDHATQSIFRNSAILRLLLMFFALSLVCASAARADNWIAGEATQVSAIVQSAPGAGAQASVPRLVQFSGTLKDATARPVAGVASVSFAIYAEQDGGTALWSETQNVLADANGHFNVLLGAATANGVPAELFGTGQSRWLAVTIAHQQEMPRVLLASVPYALKAADADTLGGLPASAYVTTQSLAASGGASRPTSVATHTTIIAAGAPQESPAVAPAVIPPSGMGTAGYIAIWAATTVLDDSALFQSGSGTTAKIGIDTGTPAAPLDVNGNTILRGGVAIEGIAATASTGQSSHSFDMQGSTYKSSTKAAVTQDFRLRVTPVGNNTATPSAQLKLFYGAGTATPADTGFSFSPTGVITFAPGQTFPGSSATVGELNLPNTTSSTNGVITLGGSAFISNYGDPSDTFIGQNSGGAFAASGSFFSNTGVGQNALYSVTTGSNNSALGAGALRYNNTGNNNTAVGVTALPQNMGGSYNSAVGFGSLVSNTSGNENVAIGYQSGQNNATGSFNTFLGTYAQANADGLQFATGIGYGAIVSASNSMVLGGTGIEAVKVGIGTPAPRSLLDMVSATASSATLPAPILTLTNTAGSGTSAGSSVSLDFNTYSPSTTGTYNPTARIEATGGNTYSDSLVFYANKVGAANSGLLQTMAIDQAGNVNITGSISKASGSFKIDDPIAPAEKYLSHSFVESPDMKNIYDGIVTLDAHGHAEVEMPAWFGALNCDFRYQLTAIGAPGPRLYIAEEMHGNRFKIAGGKAGMKVSWMVTGIRHDAWADAHRIPVEEVKPADEQGRYLHPELFGASPEMSISAAHHPVSAGADPKPAAKPVAERRTNEEPAVTTR